MKTLRELVSHLESRMGSGAITWGGDETLIIRGVAKIEDAPVGTLSYIEGTRYIHYIATTEASALVIPQDPMIQEAVTARSIAWIATAHPRWVFAQMIGEFYQPAIPKSGIHSTAAIALTVELGKDVNIGPHVVIHDRVKIGNGVNIQANVVIYPQVIIGDRTLLHANCTLHERTQIGPDCVIHSGAIIGAEGFGFVPTPQGLFKMPQSGHVVLEASVEVGCNSTIDRPALGETRIGRNTKIDNLVHIGHGSQIGENCAIAAQVGLAGAVTLGKGVFLGGQVGIADHVILGDGAIATARAGIIGNIPPKTMVSGFPALPHRLWLQTSALIKRLPHLYQSVKNQSVKNQSVKNLLPQNKP